MVGTPLCIPMVRGFHSPISPLKSRECADLDRRSYANSAHAEKDLSWAQCYTPTPADTLVFMNPISSLRSAWQSDSP